jgi:hypothetical protein
LTEPDETRKSSTLAERLGGWLTIYVAYLFVAGWTYSQAYFSEFYITPTALEFGLTETLVRGFTALFSGTGKWLSGVYLVILVVSQVADSIEWKKQFVNFLFVLLIALMFIPLYWIAGRAGRQQAHIDQGENTTLPPITFSIDKCDYLGSLLYLKGNTLFVYRLRLLPKKNVQGCLVTAEPPRGIIQSWVLQLENLQDVRIAK